ncbi:MAG: hypothetical protein J7647_07105 [Cyanobacteria bacterium SBLK]|nr:hypothetical protein [Cyanobacteria bacterium SBLK]
MKNDVIFSTYFSKFLLFYYNFTTISDRDRPVPLPRSTITSHGDRSLSLLQLTMASHSDRTALSGDRLQFHMNLSVESPASTGNFTPFALPSRKIFYENY